MYSFGYLQMYFGYSKQSFAQAEEIAGTSRLWSVLASADIESSGRGASIVIIVDGEFGSQIETCVDCIGVARR